MGRVDTDKAVVPGFFSRLKAVFDPTQYLRTSIRIMEGSGYLGSKSRPFNQRVAVEQFTSWIYTAATLNAQAVAAVPLRLFIRKRIGDKLFHTRSVPSHRKLYLRGEVDNAKPSRGVMQKVADFRDDFEEVTEEHPILQLLSHVNPFANGFDLTTLRMLYLQICGNAYIHPVVEPILQRPMELWIMPSQWTYVVPSRENFVDGYVYGQASTDQMEFQTDEVIHWKLPSLTDLHYGYSRVEAAWSAIMLHNAKRDTDQSFFDNKARPDWMLVVRAGATDTQLDRFEEKVDEKLKGTRKSGRFLTLGGDVAAQQLNFPPEQLGDQERVIEEIAGVFGVPITKLLANDPNRANAETGDAGWQRDTILPFLRLDEEKLNEQLVPMFGIEDDAFLAYDNPVPKDRTFELTRRTQLVSTGLMTINEARSEEGLELYSHDLGDVPRVGGAPLDQIGAPIMPLAAPGVPATGFPAIAPVPLLQIAPPQQNTEVRPVIDRPVPVEDANVSTLPKPGQEVVRAVRRQMRQVGQELLAQARAESQLGGKGAELAGPCVASEGHYKAKEDSPNYRRAGDTPERCDRCRFGSGRNGECGVFHFDYENNYTCDVWKVNPPTGNRGSEGLNEGDGPSGGFVVRVDEDEETGTGRKYNSENSVVHQYHCCPEEGGGYKLEGVVDSEVMPMSFKGWKAGADPEVTPQEVGSAEETERDEPDSLIVRLTSSLMSALASSREDLMDMLFGEGDSAKKFSEILAKAPPVPPTFVEQILDDYKGKLDAKLRQRIRAALRSMLATGIASGIDQLGLEIDLDLNNPEVIHFMEQTEIRLADAVSTSTVNTLRSRFSEVMESGGGVNELSRMLVDDPSNLFSLDRARTIARTESARAYVEGERQGWKQSGVVSGTEWLLAPQACEFCRSIAKMYEGVTQPMDQPFLRQGMTLPGLDGGAMKIGYGNVEGPPLHPNCRCDLIPVTRSEP